MLGYNEILEFLEEIFSAKGLKFDTKNLPMWSREIIAINVNIDELNKAKIRVIRENVPLKVFEVCEMIRDCKEVIVLPPKQKCSYCNGKGYVVGLLFDKNRIYTGYRKALNCCCGNATMVNMLMMKEDTSNNHKTQCRDGYYRIFPSIVEEFAYLDKVEKNNWRDIR